MYYRNIEHTDKTTISELSTFDFTNVVGEWELLKNVPDDERLTVGNKLNEFQMKDGVTAEQIQEKYKGVVVGSVSWTDTKKSALFIDEDEFLTAIKNGLEASKPKNVFWQVFGNRPELMKAADDFECACYGEKNPHNIDFYQKLAAKNVSDSDTLNKPVAVAAEPQKKNTVVVNLFAGPGAGKSTCAWEIASKLKKQGYVAEYVSEYAKDLVWDERYDLLDGTVEHQTMLLNEQKHRQDRLMGKVDFIVTDSPTILSTQYLKEDSPEFIKDCIDEYKSHNNFSIFIQRGKAYEQVGRIQTEEQARQLDEKIKDMLKSNKIYFGTYTYETIDLSIENMISTYNRTNKVSGEQKNVSDSDTLSKTSSSQVTPTANKQPLSADEPNRILHIKHASEPKDYYDIEQLKEIPIAEILHEYGIDEVTQAGGKFVTSVRNEKEPSFYIYPETNTFYDFGMQVGGNGINLVAYLENCDNTRAIYRLAEMFNIQPVVHRREQTDLSLTDAQYSKIGISGDLATKNFDFDIDKYGERKTAQFAEKYNMSVNELAKKYPDNYNNILKRKAIPYVYDLRNDYLSNCFNSDMMCKAVGVDILSNTTYQQNILPFKQRAEEAEKVLRAAIRDDTLKSKVRYHKYDIEKDIQNIRSGKQQFEIGTEKYAKLKECAAAADETLAYNKYSLEEFWELKNGGKLDTYSYAAFVKGDTVNVAFRPEELKLFLNNPCSAAPTP